VLPEARRWHYNLCCFFNRLGLTFPADFKDDSWMSKTIVNLVPGFTAPALLVSLELLLPLLASKRWCGRLTG